MRIRLDSISKLLPPLLDYPSRVTAIALLRFKALVLHSTNLASLIGSLPVHRVEIDYPTTDYTDDAHLNNFDQGRAANLVAKLSGIRCVEVTRDRLFDIAVYYSLSFLCDAGIDGRRVFTVRRQSGSQRDGELGDKANVGIFVRHIVKEFLARPDCLKGDLLFLILAGKALNGVEWPPMLCNTPLAEGVSWARRDSWWQRAMEDASLRSYYSLLEDCEWAVWRLTGPCMESGKHLRVMQRVSGGDKRVKLAVHMQIVGDEEEFRTGD